MNSIQSLPTNFQLDEVLRRLHSCESQVLDEISDYQNVDVANDNSNKLTLSVVVPVFNEQATVARVLSRIAALPIATEIVVVDDASTDGTRAILEKLVGTPNLTVLFKDKNEGKGAALRDAFERVSGDIILVQDADLEYDPRDIPAILKPIYANEADVVFGSRYIGQTQNDKSLVHRLGNWFLTESSNLFTGIRLTDMETCYKAFRREVLKDVSIKQNRFGVEPELTAKIARRGYRIQEVPISYKARSYEDGKKIGIRDLFKTVYCIARYGTAD